MNKQILGGQFLLEVMGLIGGNYPHESVCCSGQPGKTKQTKQNLSQSMREARSRNQRSSAKGQAQERMGDEARGQALWRLGKDKEIKCQEDQEEKRK